MIVYLDASALVKRYVAEAGSVEVASLISKAQALGTAVADTNVLTASHHGRLNGVCPDMFAKYGRKPYWVVISDNGYQHDTQETLPFYSLRAQGAWF